jgi:hypothetical protein
MPQKVSFLLGSGTSIPGGMPSVNQITAKVCSGDGVMRHNNGVYDFGQPLYAHAGIPDEYVRRVVAYLKRLYVEIEQYYSFDPERVVNYEDLYYVAAQIYDREWGGHDNPVAQAFVDKILPDIRALFTGQCDEIRREWTLDYIASEATNYIYDIVWHFLDIEPTDLAHLCCVRDAYQDVEISGLDLFTLNHDTVIERYLDGCGIKYIDGFGPPENGVRYWSPSVFENPLPNVRLLKLHGSVNWFEYEHELQAIGIAVNGRYSLYRTRNGQCRQLLIARPKLLVGTYNKMRQYTSGIYADLYFELRRALRETGCLVVCGYSFGDEGINKQLVEWADSAVNEKKVIIIIHPQPECLKRRARPVISDSWDRWLQSKRLSFVEKRIEAASWEEIKAAIRKMT